MTVRICDYVIAKLDIEGAEWEVLTHILQRGAGPLLDELLVEWHPWHEGNRPPDLPSGDRISSFFRSLGVFVPDKYFTNK